MADLQVTPIQSSLPRSKLVLYVAAGSPSSLAAQRNLLDAISAVKSPDRLNFEIIDILRHPEVALEAGLVGTPSLVLLEPSGACRLFVGDMRESFALRSWLDQCVVE